MTQMIRLLTAASTQPAQHLLPIRIVEKTVNTQDKQSSRHTSESTSNVISSYLHSEGEARPDIHDMRRNVGNLALPVRLGVFPFEHRLGQASRIVRRSRLRHVSNAPIPGS
jgi:hypothetical protein